VTSATVDPVVYVKDDDETTMSLRAETTACDPETDYLFVAAVIGETNQFGIIDHLWDQGTDLDLVAGDGVYERTIGNPFYGAGIEPGNAVVRFAPCDPTCREPAFEVDVRIDPPEPVP
jgi:hypothetical protein